MLSRSLDCHFMASFASNRLLSERLEYLEVEENTRLKKEAEKAKEEVEKAKEEAEKAKEEAEKEKEEVEKTVKAKADEFEKKHAEKEIKTIEQCDKVGFCTVYRALISNPNMDTSFLEEKEEETLALYEKTMMEEEDGEVEEEEQEEDLSKKWPFGRENGLPLVALFSLLFFASNRLLSEWLEYLEGEVHKLLSQCKVVSKHWDDSQHQNTHLKQETDKAKEEAEKAKKEAERAKEEVEKAKEEAKKEKEEAEKTIKAQADEFEKKLAEKEIETVQRCDKVGFRTVYRAWIWNPNMDTSFLKEKEEETLALCEKTRMEEKDGEVEEEEEEEYLSKSSSM
ncbi:hypothetical protein CsatB_026901 [Cannabis sativa]